MPQIKPIQPSSILESLKRRRNKKDQQRAHEGTVKFLMSRSLESLRAEKERLLNSQQSPSLLSDQAKEKRVALLDEVIGRMSATTQQRRRRSPSL